MSGLGSLLNRRPPTTWERFLSSPRLFLAQAIYSHLTDNSQTDSDTSRLCVVCISDTHSTHATQPVLPDGDLLIHAGDLTHSGTAAELDDALSWLNSQPHLHKIVIAGNHDTTLADPVEREHILRAYPTLVYLEDETVSLTIRGRPLNIHGSPRTPKHGSWMFQYPRIPPGHSDTAHFWAAVPALTDILVTHGPPFAHLDLGRTGCVALLAAVWRVRPRLHVFGHIHGARGVEHVRWTRAQKVYEDVCAGDTSGWGGLLRLMVCAVAERLSTLWRSGYGGDETMMVNAAAVGGVRDEHRQGAIVVYI